MKQISRQLMVSQLNNCSIPKLVYTKNPAAYRISYSVFVLFIFTLLLTTQQAFAQNPGTGANFSVDGGLYSGINEFPAGVVTPTDDWFEGTQGGRGVIDETDATSINALLQGSGSPTFEARMSQLQNSVVDGRIWIDAVYARDPFGGTGFTDPSAYTTASKNAQNPANWATGTSNVLGKNDIINVAGHMRRDGPTLETGDLWFFGLVVIAEPAGASYLDFEFFNETLTYSPATGFSSGGPQLGHTAFQFNQNGNEWSIASVGDFIFSTDIASSGLDVVELRIWVSREDFDAIQAAPNPTGLDFTFSGEYDGAFNNAPFGYAKIQPKSSNFGQGNTTATAAPPWGHRGTKAHTYQTTIAPLSIIEMGVNLTEFGIDHISIEGADECNFPLNTFLVKTRSSASFTAQLKDFAGPFEWGRTQVNAVIVGETELSCLNPTITLTADPIRDDASYLWSTSDGNIIGSVTSTSIEVDRPGTYRLDMFVFLDDVEGGCPADSDEVTVGFDPAKPFFESISATPSVSCDGTDGSINLSFTGGTAPYSFEWSNGENTQNISGLAPGTYSVTITDTYGCEISTEATVDAATPIEITPTITEVDCFGQRTGSISLSVTGNGPFTYLWDNGSISPNRSSLGASNYSVTVTDADGCTQTATYTVTQPTAITRSISKTDATNNDNPGNGSITLIVSGGTTPYTFQWTKERDGITTTTYSTDQNLSNLRRGKYTVLITDDNGCTSTASVNIWEPEICDDGIDNSGNGLIDCADPVCKPPVPDGLTASDPFPCVDEEVTYTVQLPDGVSYDSYVWALPSNTIITSTEPHTGQSITITWTNTAGGQICVQGKVFDCLSATVCIDVDVDDVPPAADDIIIENN
jgi:hypothetical protein